MEFNAPEETELIHAEAVVYNNEIVSISQIELIDDRYNISVSTMKEYRKNGYARTCVKACTDWWDRRDNLHWWTRCGNIPSIKLAKEFDFTFQESEYTGWAHFVLMK